MSTKQRPTYVAIVGPWALLLTFLLTWPLLGDGALVLRDMVVPASPALTDASLGLTDAAARALPQDALLAIAGRFINAAMLVRAVLWLAMIVGGVSAAYLARRLIGAGLIGQLAATTMTLWNPFVVERLLQGQWSVVVAAVLLPAVAYLVSRGFYAAAIATITLCALTPTGAIMATVVAIVAARRWAERAGAVLLGVLVSAPWLWATFAHPKGAGLTSSDAAGVTAFAARAEHGTGTVGAVPGLGGIWNSGAVPASRETGYWGLSVLLLLVLFGAGLWWLLQRQHKLAADRPRHIHAAAARRLLILAALAVALPIFFAFPPGINLLSWAIQHVPGTGLIRDTQKLVALALPGYLLMAAAGAEAVAVRQGDRLRSIAATAATIGIIVAAVPDAPAAVAPLKPQPLWQEWNVISGLVAQDDSSVAVLPGGSYRIIDGTPVLDPAQKILPANVLTTGNLLVSGTEVTGEGTTAAEVEDILLSGSAPADEKLAAALASRGVGWVLVEDSPGPLGNSADALAELDLVYDGERLILYRVPGAIDLPPAANRTGVYGTLVLWLSVLGGSLMVALYAATRRPRPARAPRRQPQPSAAS